MYSNINKIKNQFSTSKKLGALKGVRVLDLSRILVGPICSMQLSDLGAEVIKVEPFEGDETRKWGPPFVENLQISEKEKLDSAYYLSVNRNKKSLCLNLKQKEGQKIIYDLVKQSDIVLENFSAGVTSRLNIDYNTLKQYNEKLIYSTITGYGSSGPKKDYAAFDLVMQAESGYMDITGEINGQPSKLGFAITDVLTGLYSTNGVLTALYHREKTGKGCQVQTSLLECSIASLVNISSQYLNGGKPHKRMGNMHPSIVPYGTYKCGPSEEYIVLGAGTDRQFYKFCDIVGIPESVYKSEKFVSNGQRVVNREELGEIIESHLKNFDRKEMVNLLNQNKIPGSVVNGIDDIFQDDQVEHLQIVKKLKSKNYKKLKFGKKSSTIQ